MSRTSTDELADDGTILNGYDYAIHVWVQGGVVQPCGHSEGCRVGGPCCNSHIYAGQRIADIPGHEVRGEEGEAMSHTLEHVHNPSSPCTCTIQHNGTAESIAYCPLHTQAEGMRDLLKNLVRRHERDNGDVTNPRLAKTVNNARAILRAVEGR